MITSKKGIDLIKNFEKLSLRAYRCPAGVWTIGYGHTGNVKRGQRITKEQAEGFLRKDLQRFEKCVNEQSLLLTQNQFDALVSFCFNVGCHAFRQSTLLKHLRNKYAPKDWIKRQFSRWVYVKGRPNRSLKIRRRKECELFFS